MNSKLFDIVTCVGPYDNEIIKKNVEFSKKNIIGYRNIYLICSNPYISIEGVIIIDEKIFDFNIKTVEKYIGIRKRCGWYLQQLIKLYAGNTIDGILDNYLVIDSDTLFLKPTNFITNDNKYIFTTGTEYHIPYFLHINKLHPDLKKTLPLSGISHHMIFNKQIVNELINFVENFHKNSDSFYNLFLKSITQDNYDKSGASEYELYFTYLNIYHSDKIVLRKLNWLNTGDLNNIYRNYDYISYHWYLR